MVFAVLAVCAGGDEGAGVGRGPHGVRTLSGGRALPWIGTGVVRDQLLVGELVRDLSAEAVCVFGDGIWFGEDGGETAAGLVRRIDGGRTRGVCVAGRGGAGVCQGVVCDGSVAGIFRGAGGEWV